MSATQIKGKTNYLFFNRLLKSQVLSLSFVLLDQGLPDLVEDACPLLPSLEEALEQVKELACAGAGAHHFVHVAEITLPMLCSYISHWWCWDPEEPPLFTSVGPQHASDLLGYILRILYNHVGASHCDWMKQLSGIVVYKTDSLYLCPLRLLQLSSICQFFHSGSYAVPPLSR